MLIKINYSHTILILNTVLFAIITLLNLNYLFLGLITDTNPSLTLPASSFERVTKGKSAYFFFFLKQNLKIDAIIIIKIDIPSIPTPIQIIVSGFL